MPYEQWIKVKDLPPAVQTALQAVEYNRIDVPVITSSTVYLGGGADKGRRAFTVLVNLTTGQREVRYGSWGGQNMFDRENPVDNDRNTYPLPDNGVAITGSSGYRVTLATLHIPPALVARMLPAPGPELTDEEKNALYCHGSLNGGKYRREALQRYRVSDAALAGLVERGYLKQNAAGARQITTDGRNAVGTYRPSYSTYGY